MVRYLISVLICSIILMCNSRKNCRVEAFKANFKTLNHGISHVQLHKNFNSNLNFLYPMVGHRLAVKNSAVIDSTQEEEAAAADAALIQRITAEVMAESGVDLDQLINPSKVVNLERELVQLKELLKDNRGKKGVIEEIEAAIAKKEKTLFVEKRAVMRGWLKNLFVGQSVLAAAISLTMVYDMVPGFSHINLEYKVLGFWMWWLFILPSLRARKPQAEEKEALNIAFLLTPIVSLVMPSFTKDTVLIWWGNAAAVAVSYAYGYLLKPSLAADAVNSDSDDIETNRSALPSLLAKVFKALDYGSGQERGLRR